MGKNSALVNVLTLVLMPVGCLGLALIARGPAPASPAATIAGALAILAGPLMIIAKIPRLASGRLVSFGTRGLPPWAQVSYVSAYGALVFSVAALAASFHD